MNFETMPVNQLKRSSSGNFRQSAESLAFAELPQGLALFIPANQRKLGHFASNTSNSFRRRFPDRVIKSRTDVEKNGVWFFWEPKP